MTGGPVVPPGAARSAGDDGTDTKRPATHTVDPLCSSERERTAVGAPLPDDACRRCPPVHRNAERSHRRPIARPGETIRQRVVAQLLADSDFRVALAALRLPGKNRVGVLGASMSDGAVDWVALLSDVLAAARPDVELVDHCTIECTTTEALVALPGLLSQRPDHILIMLGVDDACRHGAASGVLRVSVAETHRNLSALRAMAQVEAHVGTTLITPPPAHPRRERIADSYWLAEDLSNVANIVRSVHPEAICLRTGTPPSPDYWLGDGIHPSVVGHVDIVRRIITHFSRPHQPEGGCRTGPSAASCRPLRAVTVAADTPTTAARG